MRVGFRNSTRKSDVKFTFDYKGISVDAQLRIRPDGSVYGTDFFAMTGNGRQLIYSVNRQIGTIADALKEFTVFQDSLTPKQVYENDPDRLGVGEDGPIRNSADEQVKRMNEKDPMQTSRLGFRYQPPEGQEYDY